MEIFIALRKTLSVCSHSLAPSKLFPQVSNCEGDKLCPGYWVLHVDLCDMTEIKQMHIL